MSKTSIIAIDFDGTIVEHKYPLIGAPVPGAIETMKQLIEKGHKIILWTMRSGLQLEEAVVYCHQNGVAFWGINENPVQHWSNSPKAYAHYYVDDAAVGTLLKKTEDRPMVDWQFINTYFQSEGLL